MRLAILIASIIGLIVAGLAVVGGSGGGSPSGPSPSAGSLETAAASNAPIAPPAICEKPSKAAAGRPVVTGKLGNGRQAPVLAGLIAVTAAVAAEVAEVDPAVLEAVTATRMVDPMSADASL